MMETKLKRTKNTLIIFIDTYTDTHIGSKSEQMRYLIKLTFICQVSLRFKTPFRLYIPRDGERFSTITCPSSADISFSFAIRNHIIAQQIG